MNIIKKYILAVIGLVKIGVYKLLYLHKLKVFGVVKFSPSASLEIIKNGTIELGTMSSIGSDSELATVNGVIKIGDEVHIGSNCMIISHDEVFIDEKTIIAPHVYIYDHDHKIVNNVALRDQYITKAVKIGKNVWIGTNTVILKGTVIGDNCIIGAGSVVSGTIPPNTKLIQRRETIYK